MIAYTESETEENAKSRGSTSVELRFSNGRGSAFKSLSDGTIGLIRCPKCGRENYSMNVLSGGCSWCDFSVHDQEMCRHE